jgi:hypothetical protein
MGSGINLTALLILSTFSDDNGFAPGVSMPRIAGLLRASVRGAQKIVDRLVTAKELFEHPGIGHRGINGYQIMAVIWSRELRLGELPFEEVNADSEANNSTNDVPVNTRSPKEPESKKPAKEPESREREHPRTAREAPKAIELTCEILELAATVGFDESQTRFELDFFLARCRSKGKTSADWPEEFCNWLRWPKLQENRKGRRKRLPAPQTDRRVIHEPREADHCASDVWEAAAVVLQERMNPQSFRTWIPPLRAIDLYRTNSGEVVLSFDVPNEYFADWADQHRDVLLGAVADSNIFSGVTVLEFCPLELIESTSTERRNETPAKERANLRASTSRRDSSLSARLQCDDVQAPTSGFEVK